MADYAYSRNHLPASLTAGLKTPIERLFGQGFCILRYFHSACGIPWLYWCPLISSTGPSCSVQDMASSGPCLGNVVPVDTNRSRSRYRHDTDVILTAFCGWSALFRQLPAAVFSWLAAELNTALRVTTQNPARRANGSVPDPSNLRALFCWR